MRTRAPVAIALLAAAALAGCTTTGAKDDSSGDFQGQAVGVIKIRILQIHPKQLCRHSVFIYHLAIILTVCIWK